jgi:hypothetical protein
MIYFDHCAKFWRSRSAASEILLARARLQSPFFPMLAAGIAASCLFDRHTFSFVARF